MNSQNSDGADAQLVPILAKNGAPLVSTFRRKNALQQLDLNFPHGNRLGIRKPKLAVWFIGAVALVLSASFARAQTIRPASSARALITGSIDEAKLVPLPSNTRPEAIPENDRGAVANAFPLAHVLLQLRRPPETESMLGQFLGELQDPKSPAFHKWLKADQFGQSFGVAQQDLDTIAQWLQSHGFTVNSIYPSRMVIDFSGTAGQIRDAFHTEIHSLNVNGVEHIANLSDPLIPAALAPAIVGIVSLHDFQPRAQHEMRHPTANYTSGSGTYAVVPADLATIYNLNPLFTAGYSGQGQTIAVIEDTDVFSTLDWDTFRSTFGLSSYSSGSFSTLHPAPLNGANNCADPGVLTSNEGEAILDAEWSSAAAPGAAIVLASCADTSSTFGGLIALQNLINGSDPPPALISISYGECEAEDGATANAAYNSAYQQAVAEGVSVFVSAGDGGAALCDSNRTNATHGIGVNALASTPNNVAVGGTDFSDTYSVTNSTYWSAANSSNYGSALSYIPEIPWNDSCASTLLSNFITGSGTTYGRKGFCNSSQGASYLTTAAGSGGPSGCATGSPSGGTGIVSGSCQGWAKPSWQASLSNLGNPNDGVRDLPDVSLFAANGIWGHYYIFCWSDTENGGADCGDDPGGWSAAGGTSFASPIMAGIQALINRKTGQNQGNPNSVYYQLAATEYNGSSAACNSSNGVGVSSACIFYDVTQGDMDVNCTGRHNCDLDSAQEGVLSTSNNSYDPAYGAATGWDFATGIGSVNAANLANNWPNPPLITSTASTSFLVGSQGAFTVTATGEPTPSLSESGALPGGVTFNAATGVLGGTPATGTGGVYNITFTANNGVGTAATQNFTLTVDEAPAIASANSTSFAVGSPGTFTVTATGFPVPTLSESGILPIGITFNATSGVLGGTPAAGTGGVYNITFSADTTTQNFTLTVAASTEPPSAVSVTPNSGSGLSPQTFNLVYADSGGFSYLNDVQVLFSPLESLSNSCMLQYTPSTNNLYLMNDAGTTWLGPMTLGTAGTLQNSQCGVNVGSSSVSGSGNNLTLNLPITFTSSFAGTQTIWMIAYDNAGLSSGLQNMGTWSLPLGNRQPPSAVSVTPNSGSGLGPQTFNLVYADSGGFSYLNDVQVLFSPLESLSNSCMLQYTPSTNNLYLMNDAGTTWLGPMTLGTAGTLQNSQCGVNVGSSSVSGSGNNLTLNLPITFTSSFAGTQTIWMIAYDNAGLSSGLQNMGTWSLPLGNRQPPSAVSVTPNSGSGLSPQTFNLVYADSGGFSYLNDVQVLFSPLESLSNSCMLQYTPSTNNLYLMNDAGTTWLGPMTLGTAGTLQNSQCGVNVGSSSVSGSGNNLTLNLPITFTSSFAGTQTIWMIAYDNAGLSSGLQNMGTWSLPLGNRQPPSAVSVTPNSGSGLGPQTFNLVYADSGGFSYLNDVQVLFSPLESLSNSCMLQYTPSTNNLYLMNDAGTTWLGPMTLGTAGTLQNSQCGVNVGSSSVSGSGNNLTLNLPITFTSSFAGTQTIWMIAYDNAGLSSGLQNMGTWSLPLGNRQPPSAVSVTPNSGSGLGPQTFNLVYADSDGFSYLNDVQVLFSPLESLSNSCMLQYTPSTNNLYLMNDAGTTWLGPMTLGTAGTLQNSQCGVNVGSSSVSGSGNNLTLNLPITFTSSFAGTQTIWMIAYDNAGLSSGLQNMGTWSLPLGNRQPPSAVSVTPNSGSGLGPQTFNLVYADSDGFSYLNDVQVLFSPLESLSNSCMLQYTPSTNNLYLMNDAGTTWLGPMTLGTAGTLQNSQCSVNVGSSSVSGSGNNLTLNLPITFTSSFAGTQTIWMIAYDNAGLSSGLQNMGTWSLPAAEPTSPSITSVNPGAGPVGTLVTITGTNLGTSQGASTITFNGTVAAPTNWSATAIVVSVPVGATTGSVLVTVSGLASNGITFTVTAPASSISRTGSCSAATPSCTLSAAATGNLNLFFAYSKGSSTPPSLPSGYTSIATGNANNGGTTGSYLLYCKVASSPFDTSSGTAQNASAVAGVSYSGTTVDTLAVPGTDCPVTGVSILVRNSAASSTMVTYGGLSVENPNNWIVAFLGDSAGSACTSSSLTGISSAGGVAVSDSNGTVSSFSQGTCSVTSSTWISVVLQVRGADPIPASSPGLYRSWGYAGTSGNNGEYGNPWYFALETSGPRQLAAGHLLLLYLKYPSPGVSVSSVTDNGAGGGNSYSLETSCSDSNHTYAVYYTLASEPATQIQVNFSAAIDDFQAVYRIYDQVSSSAPFDGPGECTTGITPTNDQGSNVQAGVYTTSINNDLIDAQFWDSVGSTGASAQTYQEFGSGFTGLYADPVYGGLGEYATQSTAGAINPGAGYASSSLDTYAAIVVAVEQGSSGPLPGIGIGIVRSEMFYDNGLPSPQLVPLSTSGNLTVVDNEAGNANPLTSVADSQANSYVGIAGAPEYLPNIYWASDTAPSNSTVLQLTTSDGNVDLIGIFDVSGAATSPLDTGATAANSSSLTAPGSGATYNSGYITSTPQTVVDAPSIVPSQAGDFCHAGIVNGIGPLTGSVNFTWDYVFGTGTGDSNSFDNGDGMSHVLDATTGVQQFEYTSQSPVGSSWSGLAVCFKAAQ